MILMPSNTSNAQPALTIFGAQARAISLGLLGNTASSPRAIVTNLVSRVSKFRVAPSAPSWFTAASADEFNGKRSAIDSQFKKFAEIERRLSRNPQASVLCARCWICGQSALLDFDDAHSYRVDGISTINWREQLRCRTCSLNNRMRAAIHFLETSSIAPFARNGTKTYITEQYGPTYIALKRRQPSLVGSEYLDDGTPLGQVNSQGIRNEDLTRLTFGEESFDLIVSFDVLEHVGRIDRALAECFRVLTPGGSLAFTVPFYPEQRANLILATIEDDGSVHHHYPPEYHGGPGQGARHLAFHHFGWQLLDQARAAGFSKAGAIFFWSREFGYLGPRNSILFATKSQSSLAEPATVLAGGESAGPEQA